MIPSFKVDHTKLKPGLYVSRVDKWGMETATTFDIRVCKPNKDMMSPAVAHTIEHLMADYLRNPPRFALHPSQPEAGPLPLIAAGG